MIPPVASARPPEKPLAVERRPSPIASDAEANLVFRLARVADESAQDLDLGSVEDWQRVLQIASDENAVIALRNYIKKASDYSVPQSVERYLAILALDREFRMRRLQDRLEETLTALSDAGIDVLLLKGGALA